ncbi:signal peptidase I [Marinicella sp. W31]|uniref:signal peptidase I n=1 Tax=Marinicella sp. W31 TaxID=3023713 RepID=UPI003757E184
MNEIHFDFEAFLAIATLLTGVMWVLGKFVYKKKAEGSFGGSFLGFGISFFPIFLFVLLIRTFVFEPFRIPSSSMMPTLLTGDFIWVNKYAYGLKMPVFHGTLIDVGQPERGDVVVFRFPDDQSIDYIKRVAGLPGDKIYYDARKKVVYVNNKAVEQTVVGQYEGLDPNPGLWLRNEQLGDINHAMLIQNGGFGPNDFLEVTVPKGHYFVLGDNRDNSSDSRKWGFVPERNLVGKAVFIWMHWRIPNFMEGLKRIGTKII